MAAAHRGAVRALQTFISHAPLQPKVGHGLPPMYQDLSALIRQLSLLAAQLHIGGEDLDELRKMEGQEKKVGLICLHSPPLHTLRGCKPILSSETQGSHFSGNGFCCAIPHPPPPSLTAPGSLRITPSLSPKLYSSPIAFGYYYWIYSIYFTYELVFPTKRRMGFLDAQVPELINKSDNGLQIHLTFISLSNIHVLLTWSD